MRVLLLNREWTLRWLHAKGYLLVKARRVRGALKRRLPNRVVLNSSFLVNKDVGIERPADVTRPRAVLVVVLSWSVKTTVPTLILEG